MGLRTEFITWYYNEFSQTEMFARMLNAVENSPWHREANVGVHTNMVVGQYLALTEGEWVSEDLVGAFVCAFHDVGKPAACEKNGIKFKPERGNYLSFGGHELISARMWEDWAASNWARLSQFPGFRPEDIYAVGWMIEHHLPWGVKKEDKLNMMAETALELGEHVFRRVLLADTYGRISDDGPEKKAKVEAWCASFYDRCEEVSQRGRQAKDLSPILLMPIAPSGAGKSTALAHFPDIYTHYSWDSLRTKWYGDDYAEAFKLSCEDKEFGKKVQDAFLSLVKEGVHIYVDNTNGSRKRRRFYVDQARRHGYKIVASLMPVSLDEVIARQSTRPDKTVPEMAVRQQYMNLQLPQYGEFDEIVVTDSNLGS